MFVKKKIGPLENIAEITYEWTGPDLDIGHIDMNRYRQIGSYPKTKDSQPALRPDILAGIW
jgi:hypothetical protein